MLKEKYILPLPYFLDKKLNLLCVFYKFILCILLFVLFSKLILVIYFSKEHRRLVEKFNVNP